MAEPYPIFTFTESAAQKKADKFADSVKLMFEHKEEPTVHHQPVIVHSTQNYYAGFVYCFIFIAIMALLAFTFSLFGMQFLGYVYKSDQEVLINAKTVTTLGQFMISDERIQLPSNVTDFNTTTALNNVINVNIEQFYFTEDWLDVTGGKDVLYTGLNITQLNETIPDATHEIGEFFKTNQELQEDLDNLSTVDLHNLIINLWGAVQELNDRVEALENP